MYEREDRDSFIKKIPLGVIPGGSGNGYAKVICEESKEICSAENCCYIIAKGSTKFVDVLEIERMSSDKKLYSFLSVTWGMIADIDLESEL
jgi:diacylglycerol kinase family enzyme